MGIILILAAAIVIFILLACLFSNKGHDGLEIISGSLAGITGVTCIILLIALIGTAIGAPKEIPALQAQAAQNASAAQLQLAQHDANVRLQLAQNEAADQLAVCQQTNALTTQASGNTNSILGAIQAQNAMLEQRFCEIKERELQSKIDTQSDIITQLKNQISNDHQTLQFNSAFHALDDKIDAIAAKQPNTTPVIWPNLTAVNNTPYVGQGYFPWGNGWGNGGVVL